MHLDNQYSLQNTRLTKESIAVPNIFSDTTCVGSRSVKQYIRDSPFKYTLYIYILRRKKTTTDHIFCIRQILEKELEYNETVHHLFIDFKKGYDSARREVLYNILMEFSRIMKLIKLIKMCLNETYSRVRVGKNLSDMFPIRNGLK